MAVPNLTSGERQDLYPRLFLINRSFHLIVQRLFELEDAKKLKTQYFEDLRELAQEAQLQINNRLLEEVHTVERSDWYRFGKVRRGMQKRLL